MSSEPASTMPKDTANTLPKDTANTMPKDTASTMSKDTASTMPKDTVTKVQEYKETLIQRTELLVTKRFPEIIVQLNELLTTPMFKERDFEKIHQDINIPVQSPDDSNGDDQPQTKRTRKDVVVGCPVLALPNGSVSCNKSICQMIDVVKPIIRALVEHANLLKMWISFMIPKIEDGNNFGVSVQEETLAEIRAVESDAATYFVQITAFFRSRAKIVASVAKYPHIEDYRQAVNELDEQECLNLWLVVSEIRNRYSSLHDLVIKNLEKLKRPRNSNTESLY
ncbi:proteasome activator complex subunit 3-like [Drosophila obscura]|uniref:proteasome activator complex subunit 3-like n=1 Tax=Drosophila obscura TaxID=7282 RepID=UPI001BB1D67B|nr:proteasome activator complex subunit 3-like [Drosophila obscura]